MTHRFICISFYQEMSLNFTSGVKNYIMSGNVKRYNKTVSAGSVTASLIKESTTEPQNYLFTLLNEVETPFSWFQEKIEQNVLCDRCLFACSADLSSP